MLTFFSGSGMSRLNSAAGQLNAVIRLQAVAAGHRGYAQVFGSGFPGVTLAKRAATTGSPTLPYAVGRSEAVSVPDLRSAGARAAADEAGISQRELSAMARAQDRGASNAELEAMSQRAASHGSSAVSAPR